MVAALFVAKGGAYFGLEGVDPWDAERDARLYEGPHSVVAHPPCARWCAGLADVNQARYGYKIGDDGGCFASALESVRRFGGVLEHPAFTHAWKAFGLTRPEKRGWQRSLDGGWVCEVSQCAYGTPFRKLTWLYAITDACPPAMDWSRPKHSRVISSDSTLKNAPPSSFGPKNSATPLAFRDALLAIARASVSSEVSP